MCTPKVQGDRKALVALRRGRNFLRSPDRLIHAIEHINQELRFLLGQV